jgi:hypothetical protein
LTGFIALDIPHAGKLEITSIPSGFVPGAIISIIGLALLIIYLKYCGKIGELKKSIKKVVYGIFLGVFATVIGAIYIFPIFINLLAG